jgi:hypothetical protein
MKLHTACTALFLCLGAGSLVLPSGAADARTRRHVGHNCGGTERWNVKVANDPDAKEIDVSPPASSTVADLNAIVPGPIDSGGRMKVEKRAYTVQGFLSFFKSETDGDYHVVITDTPFDFAKGSEPPNGRSMVVEFPNPRCFAGKSGKGRRTSVLGQQIAAARAAFEQNSSGLDGRNIRRRIPVTVTGVGFFDFDHGQTGRATPHPGMDGKGKVFELHPVTSISFGSAAGND